MTDFTVNGKSFPVYIKEPNSSVRGGLIVIHEVWGLTPHIKDVANRFAEKGYGYCTIPVCKLT
jgi:carboxymethylenebutenolidase